MYFFKKIFSQKLSGIIFQNHLKILMILLGVILAPNLHAQRPVQPFLVYKNVELKKLIQIYKDAHSGEGFTFRKEERTSYPNSLYVSMVFDFFPNGISDDNSKGTMTLEIVNLGLDEKCGPCHVSWRGMTLPTTPEKASDGNNTYFASMTDALHKADEKIKSKLPTRQWE